LLNILASTELFESKGQIRRLFQQGAIKLDGEKKENCEEILSPPVDEEGIVVKAGKKLFVRFLA
jgi:tyrosyl-tRNA synthetase